VGASLLAKNAKATRLFRHAALSLTTIASELAPTGDSASPENVRDQTSAARPRDAPVGPEAAEFDFDRRRPVNHAGRTQALRSGETGKDAGLAALGQGWPIAATRGAMPE